MNNNWNFINELNISGLHISSYRAEEAVIDEIIELAIIFNSYESRSLEYTKLFTEKQINNVILINFQSDKLIKEKNLKKNKRILKRLAKGKIIEPNTELNIFNYHDNINLIINLIPVESIFYGARWFLDITGEPSIYSISLLKAFKQIFPSPELYLINVSGIYSSNNTSVHKHFSEGLSGEIYIPYYDGIPDYSKPWKYIFLLGFEGERSLSILKKCEPLSSNVIIASPGYKDGYEEQAIKNNACFLHELSIQKDDPELLRIDIGDIIGVYNGIDNIYKKVKDEMNLCLVPLGPKSHALASGLFGLINNEISIMYQQPQKYYLKESVRGKFIWLYIIK